jgi:hypothetical protein
MYIYIYIMIAHKHTLGAVGIAAVDVLRVSVRCPAQASRTLGLVHIVCTSARLAVTGELKRHYASARARARPH